MRHRANAGTRAAAQAGTRTGIGFIAAIAVCVAMLGAAGACAAGGDPVAPHHARETHRAGVLLIEGAEYEVGLAGALRLNLSRIFRDCGYRAWYHNDALVVRLDQHPLDVAWLDGVYGLSIERRDGCLYLTPCDPAPCACSVCVEPVVQTVYVPTPVYVPRPLTSSWHYRPYSHYRTWRHKPHFGLSFRSGALSLHFGSTHHDRFRRHHGHRDHHRYADRHRHDDHRRFDRRDRDRDHGRHDRWRDRDRHDDDRRHIARTPRGPERTPTAQPRPPQRTGVTRSPETVRRAQPAPPRRAVRSTPTVRPTPGITRSSRDTIRRAAPAPRSVERSPQRTLDRRAVRRAPDARPSRPAPTPRAQPAPIRRAAPAPPRRAAPAPRPAPQKQAAPAPAAEQKRGAVRSSRQGARRAKER